MKHFAAAKAALSKHARTFVQGGPVGVYYARKLARINRRLAKVSIYIHRENELHRDHVRLLNWELNELVKEQQAASAAARLFWQDTKAEEVRS